MDVLLTRSYKIIKFQKSIETLFKRKLQTNVTSIESVKSFDSIPGKYLYFFRQFLQS